jgi:hypothetical protein
MILSLFIISSLLSLIGLFNFIKKKPLLGWLFMLAGLTGIAIAFIVISIYPDKI